MRKSKLLAWETGFCESYELTPLCIIGDDSQIERAISDWIRMPDLFIERLRAAKGIAGVDQMKRDFVAEFPYFDNPNTIDMLITVRPTRESLTVMELPYLPGEKDAI